MTERHAACAHFSYSSRPERPSSTTAYSGGPPFPSGKGFTTVTSSMPQRRRACRAASSISSPHMTMGTAGGQLTLARASTRPRLSETGTVSRGAKAA